MSELRVMSWNVQNLFVAGEVDGPDTESEFDAKVTSLAAVIDEFRPHVLALQEVGTPPAVRELQRALSWAMPYAEAGEPDDRGIRVAFLGSRVLRDPVQVRVFPSALLPVQVGDDPSGPAGPPLMNQMGRGALEVTIRGGGRDVRLVTCHLKSKLLTFSGDRFTPDDEDERARYAGFALFRRTAEAVTLRHHVTARLAGQGRDEAYLLVGDLNDDTVAATTQILQGPPGSEIGTAGFDRPDAGDGERLWNLAPLIPPERAYTRIYRGRRELIDHVLASHLLVTGAEKPEITTVCSGDELPSMEDDPDRRRNAPGSDHAAVTVRLHL